MLQRFNPISNKFDLIDDIGGGFFEEPTLAATTGNLNATYDNGSAGVGATLTNAGALAALTIDGVSLSTSDRILVKNQSDATENGIYIVTTVGDGATAWVLTRDVSYDTPDGS